MIQSFYRVLSVLLLSLPQFLMADVTPNAIFSDHMVVQRETEIPVWGWADAGEKISVTASWGAKSEAVTNADSTWRVDLKTPKAGGPFTITISGKNTIVLNDVLSGEVWLCTGQSNMDFAMSKFVNDAREPQYQPLVEYMREEIKTADDDWLRHIEVPQTTSFDKKLHNFEGDWVSATPGGIEKITATGYFFAKELRESLDVPVGLVECSWGGTRIQPWISEEAFLADKNLKDYYETVKKETYETIEKMNMEGYVDTKHEAELADWEKKGEKGRKPRPAVHPKEDRQAATTLYNGMLNSIIPYKIKGAIWYQGESNALSIPNEYEELLTTLIKSWRADWNQGDFSFYWAQLAACNRDSDEADKGWAVVNNEMRKALKIPNTGMAVLYDIGEARDVHPHNKMDTGKRLAYWALVKDYNKKVKILSGPLYESAKSINGKIEISFTHTGSGLMVGHKHLLNDVEPVKEPLSRFEIVGKDGEWKPAEAKITSKNKIEVWNTSISQPVNVRYAWASNPEGANLYNKEGLPASVFSTEQ